MLFASFVVVVVYVFRLRLAGGYVRESYSADVFFWLMHSITLPLHGK